MEYYSYDQNLLEPIEIKTNEWNCKSCGKVYSLSDKKAHYNRSPLCKKWIEMFESKNEFVKYVESKMNEQNEPRSLKCIGCEKEYESISALNKHYLNTLVCRKFKEYTNISNVFSKIYEVSDIKDSYGIVPKSIPSSLHFIIWNLFLTDKLSLIDKKSEKEKTTSVSFSGIQNDFSINRIRHIICIVPEVSEVSSIVEGMYYNKEKIEVDYLLYNDHTTEIDKEQYNIAHKKMAQLQKERKNVLIFCNSGYQRSFPFLCSYLLNYHLDEIQNLRNAISLILLAIKSDLNQEDIYKSLIKLSIFK